VKQFRVPGRARSRAQSNHRGALVRTDRGGGQFVGKEGSSTFRRKKNESTLQNKGKKEIVKSHGTDFERRNARLTQSGRKVYGKI